MKDAGLCCLRSLFFLNGFLIHFKYERYLEFSNIYPCELIKLIYNKNTFEVKLIIPIVETGYCFFGPRYICP